MNSNKACWSPMEHVSRWWVSAMHTMMYPAHFSLLVFPTFFSPWLHFISLLLHYPTVFFSGLAYILISFTNLHFPLFWLPYIIYFWLPSIFLLLTWYPKLVSSWLQYILLFLTILYILVSLTTRKFVSPLLPYSSLLDYFDYPMVSLHDYLDYPTVSLLDYPTFFSTWQPYILFSLTSVSHFSLLD